MEVDGAFSLSVSDSETRSSQVFVSPFEDDNSPLSFF